MLGSESQGAGPCRLHLLGSCSVSLLQGTAGRLEGEGRGMLGYSAPPLPDGIFVTVADYFPGVYAPASLPTTFCLPSHLYNKFPGLNSKSFVPNPWSGFSFLNGALT